jgi:hypothetical protein
MDQSPPTLGHVKKKIENLPRDDRAMLRVHMLATYGQIDSKHVRVHDQLGRDA